MWPWSWRDLRGADGPSKPGQPHVDDEEDSDEFAVAPVAVVDSCRAATFCIESAINHIVSPVRIASNSLHGIEHLRERRVSKAVGDVDENGDLAVRKQIFEVRRPAMAS